MLKAVIAPMLRAFAPVASSADAYNFAYSDRFAQVTVTLDAAKVDTLNLVLLDSAVQLPG
jgi:hypothetical protein